MTRVFLAAEAGSPLSPVAAKAHAAAAAAAWADPSLRAHEGRSSASILQAAAASVATSVARPQARVMFLPGLSEAVRFAASYIGSGPLICSAVERKAVLAVARSRGSLAPLSVDSSAAVNPTDVAAALEGNPGPVAVQVGNPEVGTCQPVAEIHQLCRAAGVPLLLDASMAAGRTPLPRDWDALVLDARSWAGGNDVAAVVVSPGTPWASASTRGVVAELPVGAPDVPACAGAALSLESAIAQAQAADSRSRALINRIRAALRDIPEVQVHGETEHQLPHILGFSALYVDAEALLLALDRAGIAVASGSACTVDTGEPSHVLAAAGALTSGNVRITLPLEASESDIEALLSVLPGAIAELRAESGL